MGPIQVIKKAIITRSILKRRKAEQFDAAAAELFTLPPDADAFYNNSYFFTAHDLAGNSLVFRLGLKGGGRREVWFIYRDRDSFVSDPVEFYNDRDCPLRVTCAEPGKRWDVHYKGTLADQKTGKTYKAEFKGSFTATGEIFDFFHHGNPEGTAASLAAEKWTKRFFEEVGQNNQRHYEQRGVIEGTITLDGREKPVRLNAARDHSYGHRSWAYMDRHIWFLIINEKGETLNFSLVGYPVVKKLVAGYTDFGGKHASLVKYTLEGDVYCDGKGPDDCRLLCTMDDGRTYDIRVHRDGAVTYNFENGGYVFHEGLGSFEVNGERCRGTIEFAYNGDRSRWGEGQKK